MGAFPATDGDDEFLPEILPVEMAVLRKGESNTEGLTFPVLAEAQLAVQPGRGIFASQHAGDSELFEIASALVAPFRKPGSKV